MDERVAQAVERLEPVDLEEVEERAALQQRVDRKYFDTADLRAYREHIEGARPRFKVRSRLYVDGGKSVFELKVKNDDDETVKEHREGDGAQRVTFDLDLELAAPDDRVVRLDDGFVLGETKSEGDDGRADQLLADRGIEEVSMSKYRTGIGLLVADEPDEDSRAVADRFV